MDNQKKILVVSQHFWPESFRINDICEFIADKGCSVNVLCGVPNYPQGNFFDGYSLFKNRRQIHKGIKICRVFEIPRGNNSNIRIFLNYISYSFASLFHVPRLLFSDYNKIFLYQTSPVIMSIAGIIVGKIKKVETTMYVLDLWPENLYSVLNINSKFLRRVAEKVSHWHYLHVDKIIVISEKMRSKIKTIVSLPDNKIIFVPQICEKIYEKDIFDKKLKGRFKNGFNLVFAGNISPAQDFGTLVAAAKKLKKGGIKDINWIIVGDGMSKKWLEKIVKEEGLQDDFSFEGLKPITEIPKYHTIADGLIACLVKSDLLDATIPSKVLSYFAAGRPIILAMDGEAQDLVNKVGCGLAGNSGDIDSLYQNVYKLYKMTKEDRENMGKRGRTYHFEHFERNTNLEKLYNFINN